MPKRPLPPKRRSTRTSGGDGAAAAPPPPKKSKAEEAAGTGAAPKGKAKAKAAPKGKGKGKGKAQATEAPAKITAAKAATMAGSLSRRREKVEAPYHHSAADGAFRGPDPPPLPTWRSAPPTSSEVISFIESVDEPHHKSMISETYGIRYTGKAL